MCDLADAGSVQAAVDVAVSTWGRLDVAFNNAATIVPPGPLDRATDDDFDRVYTVNLKGVFVAMKAEIAAIRATAGSGAIVNTSSVGSLKSNPELPAYGAMKRVVNSLTESAAVTYGPENIRVNAITPGTTLTEMIQEWEDASPGVIERLVADNPWGGPQIPPKSPRRPCGCSATGPPMSPVRSCALMAVPGSELGIGSAVRLLDLP